jgi:hypothetical protein
MLEAARSRDRVPMRWIFSNLPIPPSCIMSLESTQTLNRNDYQESSWGLEGGRRVGLTSPPSVSRLSRQNVGASSSHQPYGPPRPITGIVLVLAY